MPFDFATYTVLAVIAGVAVLALIVAAVLWPLRAAARRHQTRITYRAAHRAEQAHRTGMVELYEDDGLTLDGIDAVMDYATGVGPDIVITRPLGELCPRSVSGEAPSYGNRRCAELLTDFTCPAHGLIREAMPK